MSTTLEMDSLVGRREGVLLEVNTAVGEFGKGLLKKRLEVRRRMVLSVVSVGPFRRGAAVTAPAAREAVGKGAMFTTRVSLLRVGLRLLAGLVSGVGGEVCGSWFRVFGSWLVRLRLQ